VVGEVPLDELLEPDVEVGGRLVAELLPREGDVGVREWHVAIAGHLDHVLLGLHAEVLLQDGHQVGHRHRRGVAEVEDPVGRRPALLAPGAGALPGRVERAEAALDDVVDVGEVAGEVDAVLAAVHRDGLPLQDVAGEGEVGHVRPPPWPVHGEEAESGDGEAVDVVVRVGDLLAGLLGGGVQRRRLVSAVALREGHLVVEAVDGGGGGPDDGRLRVGVLACLEEGDEAGDVGVHVGRRVLHGVAHARLRREVEHVREGHDVEELGEEAAVVDVALDDEHPVRGEQRPARLLERGVVVGVEVVDADDAVAALAEREGAVRADEPGGARHEHRHPRARRRPGRPPRRGGRADLALPVQPAPGGGEVLGRGVDEGLEAEVRRGHGDEEERPEEHGAGRRE
ncbi:Os02g0791450, partial [Oryza sativa Japonica Group]